MGICIMVFNFNGFNFNQLVVDVNGKIVFIWGDVFNRVNLGMEVMYECNVYNFLFDLVVVEFIIVVFLVLVIG